MLNEIYSVTLESIKSNLHIHRILMYFVVCIQSVSLCRYVSMRTLCYRCNSIPNGWVDGQSCVPIAVPDNTFPYCCDRYYCEKFGSSSDDGSDGEN